jgi:hypothetical protein
MSRYADWTTAEEDFFCDHYGVDLSPAKIAAALGRTIGSVRALARHVEDGRPKRRFWSAAELADLTAHYGKQPARVIAARLGRSVGMVHRHARKIGLGRAVPPYGPREQDLIRELAGLRWCNACIARRLGRAKEATGRYEVRMWRRRLGLPAVGTLGTSGECPTCVAKIRATTAEQCRKAGVRSLAEVRGLAFRDYARRHGWPEDLRPRAVQILEVLARCGPMTRPQIAEAIGMPWRGTRSSLKSNDAAGSYLAELQRRGLVDRSGRIVKGQGVGKSISLYALTTEAEDQKDEFEKQAAG